MSSRSDMSTCELTVMLESQKQAEICPFVLCHVTSTRKHLTATTAAVTGDLDMNISGYKN